MLTWKKGSVTGFRVYNFISCQCSSFDYIAIIKPYYCVYIGESLSFIDLELSVVNIQSVYNLFLNYIVKGTDAFLNVIQNKAAFCGLLFVPIISLLKFPECFYQYPPNIRYNLIRIISI